MRYVLALISCLIAGCLGSFPNQGESEKSPWRNPEIKLQGGCIAPAAPNENIRMDLMQVTIRQKRDSYTVDAVFHLFNTGETATEMVGVPKYGEQDTNEWPVNPRVYDFLRFDAWVDGRKTGFKEVRHFLKDPNAPPIEGYPFAGVAERPETRWMVKKVTFPGKGLTTIRTRYEALYHYFLVPSCYDLGRYYCSMGQYWKGTIRKAIFIIDKTDLGSKECPGPPSAITRCMYRTEMRQYEPPTVKPFEFLGTGLGAELKMRPGASMPNQCSGSSGSEE